MITQELKKDVIQNNYLKFEITAGFNDVNKSVSSEYLFEIGSLGLANRLKKLLMKFDKND